MIILRDSKVFYSHNIKSDSEYKNKSKQLTHNTRDTIKCSTHASADSLKAGQPKFWKMSTGCLREIPAYSREKGKRRVGKF